MNERYKVSVQYGSTDVPAQRQDAAPEQEGSESSRFEDLTRKLVQVPKKEVDERRKKAQ